MNGGKAVFNVAFSKAVSFVGKLQGRFPLHNVSQIISATTTETGHPMAVSCMQLFVLFTVVQKMSRCKAKVLLSVTVVKQ